MRQAEESNSYTFKTHRPVYHDGCCLIYLINRVTIIFQCIKIAITVLSWLVGYQQQSLGSKLHTDGIFIDVYIDVVLTDVHTDNICKDVPTNVILTSVSTDGICTDVQN